MNLHAIATKAICAVNANEIVTLYQASGQENMRGLVAAKYLAPQTIAAQVQAEYEAALQHIGETGQASVQSRFYVQADALMTPQGLVRQLDRSGDIIERSDGTFWLVTAVPDDFVISGWVCLRATLQTIAPDFTGQEWYDA